MSEHKYERASYRKLIDREGYISPHAMRTFGNDHRYGFSRNDTLKRFYYELAYEYIIRRKVTTGKYKIKTNKDLGHAAGSVCTVIAILFARHDIDRIIPVGDEGRFDVTPPFQTLRSLEQNGSPMTISNKYYNNIYLRNLHGKTTAIYIDGILTVISADHDKMTEEEEDTLSRLQHAVNKNNHTGIYEHNAYNHPSFKNAYKTFFRN